MRENTLNIYSNGASARIKNKRIVFEEKEDGFMIKFLSVIEGPDKRTCSQLCHRGKLRDTTIGISEESMDILFLAYGEYQKHKRELINK